MEKGWSFHDSFLQIFILVFVMLHYRLEYNPSGAEAGFYSYSLTPAVTQVLAPSVCSINVGSIFKWMTNRKPHVSGVPMCYRGTLWYRWKWVKQDPTSVGTLWVYLTWKTTTATTKENAIASSHFHTQTSDHIALLWFLSPSRLNWFYF